MIFLVGLFLTFILLIVAEKIQDCKLKKKRLISDKQEVYEYIEFLKTMPEFCSAYNFDKDLVYLDTLVKNGDERKAYTHIKDDRNNLCYLLKDIKELSDIEKKQFIETILSYSWITKRYDTLESQIKGLLAKKNINEAYAIIHQLPCVSTSSHLLKKLTDTQKKEQILTIVERIREVVETWITYENYLKEVPPLLDNIPYWLPNTETIEILDELMEKNKLDEAFYIAQEVDTVLYRLRFYL